MPARTEQVELGLACGHERLCPISGRMFGTAGNEEAEYAEKLASRA